MTELCKLATKYGTDKAGWYTPVYDLLLKHKRHNVFHVLEIGVGTPEAMRHVAGYKPGASLRMWRDYFPAAHVTGVDSDAGGHCVEEGIDTKIADQGNAAQLRQAVEGCMFDLIVDDGSHNPYHQILGVRTLMPYLRKGGLYIIEDVNNFDEIQQAIDRDAICITHPGLSKMQGRCMVLRG